MLLRYNTRGNELIVADKVKVHIFPEVQEQGLIVV
jgi:hypothetical protein